MREILFRGKRILGKQEWTYGVPFIDHEGDCIFKTSVSEFIVDGKTVGQYTGLTDKNGKKIFEEIRNRCGYSVAEHDGVEQYHTKCYSIMATKLDELEKKYTESEGNI